MKQAHLILISVAVLILVGGVYAFSQQKNVGTAEPMVKEVADTMVKSDDSMLKGGSSDGEMVTDDMTQAEDDMMKDDVQDADVMMKGVYETYSPEKLARAETGKVVLFFKATWCPTCRALDADIKKNLESIPEGVSILELNFDTETELRKRYGVTVQHTLVQVDATGNQITKWSGGNTLATVLSRLQ